MPDYIRIAMTTIVCFLPFFVAIGSVRHLMRCSESNDVEVEAMEAKHMIYGVLYALGWILCLVLALVVASNTWADLSPKGFNSTTSTAQLAVLMPGFALVISLFGSQAIVCWGIQEIRCIAEERYEEV